MDKKVFEIVLQLKDLASKQLKSSLSVVNDSFKEAERSSSRFGETLKDVGKIAAGIGLYKLAEEGFRFAKSMVEAGFETASFYENARIQLTTFLKDAAKAEALLNQIKKDALRTPFDTRALVEAVSLLVSAGEDAEEARKTVLALGNALLAAGRGNAELMRMAINLQQIKATGKATALDIRQFGYAGINIYKLLGESAENLRKKNKGLTVTYEDLKNALLRSQKAGGFYFGAMERAAGSFQQRLSNLKEALDNLGATIVKETGLFDLLKNVMAGLTDLINSNLGAIQSFGERVRAFIESHNTLIRFVLIAMGVFVGLVGVLALVGVAFAVLVGVVGFLLSPLNVVLMLISLLTAGFIVFKNQILDVVNNAINFLVNGFNILKTSILSLVAGIVSSIVGFVSGVYGAVLPFLEVLRGIIALIVGGFLMLQAFIFNVLSFIAFGIIMPILSGVFNFILGILTSIVNAVLSRLNYLKDKVIVPILNAIKVVIETVLNLIVALWNSTLGKIISKVSSGFNQIKNIILSKMSEARKGLASRLGDMLSNIAGFVSKAIGKFKKLASGITSALRSIKFPHISLGEGSITIMGREIKYPKINVDWYQTGGWVKRTGLAMLHAGEFVLSRDMLRGLAPVPSEVRNVSNQKIVVYATINNEVDVYDLAYKLGWILRND